MDGATIPAGWSSSALVERRSASSCGFGKASEQSLIHPCRGGELMHRYGGDRQDPDDVLSFNPVNQSSSPTFRPTRRGQENGCRELSRKAGYAEAHHLRRCHLEPRKLSGRLVRALLRAVATNGRDANASASLICRKPLLFHASIQTKAFVAPGRDLVAFLFVCGNAADIRHEHAGFPRNVGADVP